MSTEYLLPTQLDQVRQAIEDEQGSSSDADGSGAVEFSDQEMHAEIRSSQCETFSFTDLPGIFLVGDKKMGKDYATSRSKNEALTARTMDITKKYLMMPNTICFLVISSSDWMHGMNNDTLVSSLAAWLEEIRTREQRHVLMYGVITKLDTQDTLSAHSPVKKVLLGQLGQDHILHGLRVRKMDSRGQ